MREFLRDELPVLPGSYPSRPSPAHILNNFAYFSLGAGRQAESFARLVAKSEGIDTIFESAGTTKETSAAQHLVKAIYDSDGNVYADFSSPYLTSPEFVRRDPSDDGFALGLWRALGPTGRGDMAALMKELLDAPASDVVAQVTQVLERRLNSKDDATPPPPMEDQGSGLGAHAGAILLAGMRKCGQTARLARRLENTRRLGIMISGLTILALLYDPIASARLLNQEPADNVHVPPSDALGVFVYTGETPGQPEDPLVGLAVRSLEDAIHRAHSGFVATFESVVQRDMRNSGRRAKRDQLLSVITERLQEDHARSFLRAIDELGGLNSLEAFANESIDISLYRRSIKSLGYKVGISAPQRQGSLRLVLETNFLTALAFFLAHDNMDVQAFVDVVYDRLGLIVGSPRNLATEAAERLSRIGGRAFDLDQALTDAQELLRQRLITSGLAREYSDGLTLLGEP